MRGRTTPPLGRRKPLLLPLANCRAASGDYKRSDYDKVILPFTVLRRLDCVLEPTKEEVLMEKALREEQ